MLSNDRNIETIGQLVEVLKHYIGLQKEYVKLDVIEKIVKLIKALAIITAGLVIAALIIIFLSFAIVYALEPLLGFAAAYCIVAGFYLLLFIIFVMFRKNIIERPLVKFLTALLLDK